MRVLPFLILPFAIFYWLLPFVSSTTIGSDYPLYSIAHQQILQFALRNGEFPLFLPGFAGGQSAAAATLGQLFHPISHLAALVPGYWNGAALEIYTTLCLLSLGAAHHALDRVVRGLDVAPPTAYIASFLAVYNLRMLDLFRYGASLQNYVGFVLVAASLLHLHAHGATFTRAALVVASTYLMLCGGHPQIAYLGLLGAVLVALLAPPYVRTLRPDLVAETRSRARDHVVALGAIAAGTLLSSAYLMQFYFDVAGNIVRTEKDFHWVVYPFRTASLTSLLHSVFKPFWSDVHGSFAGSPLFAVPLLMPLLAAIRPLPRVLWAIWLACVAVLCLALADTLPLYFVLWSYLPAFASFRVPGRTTMLLPLLLALLLIWVLESRDQRARATGRWSMGAVLGLAALLLYAIYAATSWTYFEAKEVAPPARFRDIPQHAVSAVLALGAAALALLALYAAQRRRLIGALLVAVVIAQQTVVFAFGTWTTRKTPSPTYQQIASEQRDSIGFHARAGAGMESPALLEHVRRMRLPTMSSRFAELFWSYRLVGSQDEAYAILRPSADFVGPQRASSVVEAPRGADHRAAELVRGGRGKVELIEGSFNRLRFRVRSSAPGLLKVGYFHSAHWRATVDGSEVPVWRANAAWLGVFVPRGASEVELRYVSPAAFWGTLTSLFTAWSLAVVALLRTERRVPRLAGIAVVTLLAIVFFAAWQRSLHAGSDLGMSYSWASAEAAKEPKVVR